MPPLRDSQDDDTPAREVDPLLWRSSGKTNTNALSNNTEINNGGPPQACEIRGNENSKKLLSKFVAILLLLLAILAAAWVANESLNRSHDDDTGNPIIHESLTSDGTVNEDCWWCSTDVTTTETFLPGLLPDQPNHSSSRHNKNSTNKRKRKLRWGVLGLGRIAKDFTTALRMTGADVTAAAAGSLPNATARARAFAKLYSIPQSYGSYQAMAEDTNIDIVYIATINTLHYDVALQMLKAGKNVLLEKPMTMKYEQAQMLAATAKKEKRLLLTNYWTRFFPVVKYARSVLASKELGDVNAMRGDFGFPAVPDIKDRFLNRTQGGGAMLDLGCYLVNVADMVNPTKDAPYQLQATAQRTYMGVKYGVDTELSFALNWKKSSSNKTTETPFLMTGQASFRRPSSFEIEIDATHGRLVIHSPANAATAATVYKYAPFGPMKEREYVRSELPTFDESFGAEEYPRGAGFIYIIQDIEKCMYKEGIPGSKTDRDQPGCLELEPLTMQDQLNTAQMTDLILQNTGYFDW